MALAAACGTRAALWVSEGGDDANPGTEEQPLRTLAHAQQLVRAQNREMTDDLTVFVAGEHRLDKPLEFGPEDSGTNGFNVIYTAAPGEHPVVSGGFRIRGWTLVDKDRNLWSAPAPEGLLNAYYLYVNGSPARRTLGRLLQVFSKDSAGGAAPVADARANWKNPSDIVFVPPGPGSIWSERSPGAPFFVENASELLGVPGFWYFDRPARLIYYTPRVGEDMATADVVAASAEALVRAAGTRERPLVGLIFKGLRFEYAGVSAPADASPEGAAPLNAPAAAVSVAYASAVQFLEDEFLHMATPALQVGPAVEGGTVDGCAFAQISWSALRVTGSALVRIAESRFTYVATEHTADGAIDIDHCAQISIESNQIDHFPDAGIRESEEKPGAVHEESNRVSQPMIRFHGGQAEGAPESADAGIPAAYRSLLGMHFSALTTPRPPSHVSAEPEDRFAYVTWIPSCLDGGAPVTSYTVASSTGASAVVSAEEFRARGYMVFSGLENGHGVTFAVTATNRVGSSAASPPTANVTPNRKKRLKPPPAPAIVAVTSGKAGTSIRITPSSSDGGSPVIAYSVSIPSSGAHVLIEGLDVIRSDVAHPFSRMILDVPLGPMATVSVTARNVAGEGQPTVVKLAH